MTWPRPPRSSPPEGFILSRDVHHLICGDGKRATEYLEIVVKTPLGVEPGYLLAQHDLQLCKVLVGLRKLRPGVAEEILHVGHLVPHVHRQGAGVLAS